MIPDLVIASWFRPTISFPGQLPCTWPNAHSMLGSATTKGSREPDLVPRFYQPDLGANPDDPFARDKDGKLVRRSFWLDLSDQSAVLAMTQGIGAALTNDEKRAHLADIRRAHLIDDVCVQEILPPED